MLSPYRLELLYAASLLCVAIVFSVQLFSRAERPLYWSQFIGIAGILLMLRVLFSTRMSLQLTPNLGIVAANFMVAAMVTTIAIVVSAIAMLRYDSERFMRTGYKLSNVSLVMIVLVVAAFLFAFF